jgi:hypothetical protein
VSFADVLFIPILVGAGNCLAAGAPSCNSRFPWFARLPNELLTRVPKRSYALLWAFYAFLCTFYAVSMRFLYRKEAVFALSHAVFPRNVAIVRSKSFFRAARTRQLPPPIAEPGNKPITKRCIPVSILSQSCLVPVLFLSCSCLVPVLKTPKNRRKSMFLSREEIISRREPPPYGR